MSESFEQKFSISPLDKLHQRKDFCCGINALDTYLQKQAGQENRKLIAITYVLMDDETQKIAGYYTLSSTTISLNDLPDRVAQKLPLYPLVPATLIGRLAVDRHYQKQGLGEILLFDALNRAKETSIIVASFSVIVDAIDEHAIEFYKKYGFLQLPDKKSKLYLPMKTISKV